MTWLQWQLDFSIWLSHPKLVITRPSHAVATLTVLHHSVMGFRISLKNAVEWYVDHPVSENCLLWLDLFHIRAFYHEIQNLLWKCFINHPVWRNCLFWLDLFHIRQYYYVIQNLLQKCFINHPVWGNCLFWLNLFHIRQYYHEIQNLPQKYFINHPVWGNCLFCAIPHHIGKYFCHIPPHSGTEHSFY